MDRTKQLRTAIITILWTFPVTVLSERILLFGLDVIYVWFRRPPYWEPAYYFIVIRMPYIQEYLFMLGLILLCIVMARQSHLTDSHQLKYAPILVASAYTGIKVFASHIAYKWCPGCAWTSWFYDLSVILLLLMILVLALNLPRIKIGDIPLRIVFLVLFPVSVFMGLHALSTLILGTVAWNEFSSDLAEHSHVFMRPPVYPSHPYVWLTFGMTLVCIFGVLGFWFGLRGVLGLRTLREPASEVVSNE